MAKPLLASGLAPPRLIGVGLIGDEDEDDVAIRPIRALGGPLPLAARFLLHGHLLTSFPFLAGACRPYRLLNVSGQFRITVHEPRPGGIPLVTAFQ